jgi:hypothetical protein
MAPLDQCLIPDEKAEIALAGVPLRHRFRMQPKRWYCDGMATQLL